MRSREQANSTPRDASATAATADMQFRASAPLRITQLRSLFTGESGFGPAVAGDVVVTIAVVEFGVKKIRKRFSPLLYRTVTGDVKTTLHFQIGKRE